MSESNIKNYINFNMHKLLEAHVDVIFFIYMNVSTNTNQLHSGGFVL
jgi:hypothetical protein